MDEHNEREPSKLKDELKELKNAMPIKKGGLRLLASFTASTLFILGFVNSCGNICMDILNGDKTDPFLALLTALVAVLCCAIFFPFLQSAIMRGITQTPQVKWLKTYLQNNIRGNTALVILVNGQLSIRIFDWMSVEKPDLPEGSIAIEVPLGGWFNRPRSTKILGADSWWYRPIKIRIDSIPGGYPFNLKIQDPNGSKICGIDALTFLQILNNSSSFEEEPPHCWGFSVDQLVFALNSKKASLQDGLKKAVSIRAEKEDKLLIALDTLFKESQALKDTSRVGKSKEGKAIRERMEASLLDLLPPDDSRRKVLEPQPQTQTT